MQFRGRLNAVEPDSARLEYNVEGADHEQDDEGEAEEQDLQRGAHVL